jgi:AcrR family transcriptional regulator
MIDGLRDGLRERKKRETRQRISDVATQMFIAHGFDAVTIADIAAQAGVSEKTIYNYFPTKEALVYDQADEQLERLVAAVRERPRGTSPTNAVVAALKQDSARISSEIGESLVGRISEFGAMVQGTPALRAAWGEHRHAMVDALRVALAEDLGVDPDDPEPQVAARALVSLLELFYDALPRHARSGVSPEEMRRRVDGDLDRGARLLETGMWSLHLMVEGRRTNDQLREATVVAEQARQQVLSALREAKRGWRDVREEARAAGRDLREGASATAREHRDAAREAARQQRAAGREQKRAAIEAARERGRAL